MTPPKNKASKRITFYVTEEEQVMMEVNSKKKGFPTLKDYIRYLIHVHNDLSHLTSQEKLNLIQKNV